MALSKRQRIERLVNKIEEHFPEDDVNWLGGCSESRIDKVESILGVKLPDSYREFVRLKGGGGLESFIIFGIPPKGTIADGGVIGEVASEFREDWAGCPLPIEFVPVQHDPDLMTPFCLDTSRMKRGECPVVAYALSDGSTEDVSPDFVTFYEEYTAPYFTE